MPVGRFRPSDSAVSQGAQMELPRDPSRGLPFVHCTHAGVSRPRSERARRGVARKNVRERLSRSGDDKMGIYRAKIRKGHDPDPQEPTKSRIECDRQASSGAVADRSVVEPTLTLWADRLEVGLARRRDFQAFPAMGAAGLEPATWGL